MCANICVIDVIMSNNIMFTVINTVYHFMLCFYVMYSNSFLCYKYNLMSGSSPIKKALRLVVITEFF